MTGPSWPYLLAMALLGAAAWWNALAAPRRRAPGVWLIAMLCVILAMVIIDSLVA